jgi:hypothetical protein
MAKNNFNITEITTEMKFKILYLLHQILYA